MNSYPDNADSIILVDNQVWFENPDGTRLFGYDPATGLVDANGDPITGGGGSSVLKTFRKVLTNAQIKALPSVPIQLVAAVSGKIIVPISCVLVAPILWGSGADYEGIDAAAQLTVGMTSSGASGLNSLLADEINQLLSSSGRSVLVMAPSGFVVDSYLRSGGATDANAWLEDSLSIFMYNGMGSPSLTEGGVDNYLIAQGTYIEVDTTNTP